MMSNARDIIKELQKSASATHQLREKLSKKLLLNDLGKHTFDSENLIGEWIQCTPFLNHILQHDYLQGNYFHYSYKETANTLKTKYKNLKNELTNEARATVMNATKSHWDTKVAANFYEEYVKLFNKEDPAFWHKLVYRLIKKEYITQGSKAEHRTLMIEFANVANDKTISEMEFNKQLNILLKKMNLEKSNLPLQELIALQENWAESSFLAHLTNDDFIQTHRVFLEEKRIFKDLKAATSSGEDEVKAYLEQYEIFLQNAEAAFILAMNQRARIKLLCKGNHYLLNPLMYVYDQVSNNYKFDEPLFPLVTYPEDSRTITLYQVDNEKERQALYCDYVKSNDCYCYCYDKSTQLLYKFTRREETPQLKIELKKGVIDTFIEPSTKDKQISPQAFLQLQKAFIRDKSLNAHEVAARSAVLITIPFADSLSDEQFNYYAQCTENYIVDESTKLLNIETFFQNNKLLINKFRKYAASLIENANQFFDDKIVMYPLEFIELVLLNHEKTFPNNSTEIFLMRFRLKQFVEKNKLIQSFTIANQNESINDWLRKNINCYLMIEELNHLIGEADFKPSGEQIEKIQSLLNHLQLEYLEKNNLNIVADFLNEQRTYFENKLITLKEKHYQHNLEGLMKQLLPLYFENKPESFTRLLNITYATVNHYKETTQNKTAAYDNMNAWKIALREVIKVYQKTCLQQGNELIDLTPIFLIYDKGKGQLNSYEEKNARIQYHLKKNTPKCLNDDGSIILQLIDANTSINFHLQPSVLSNQRLTRKKSGEQINYFVPGSLKKWLVGDDLDKRIKFVEEKNDSFLMLDQGLKAAASLTTNHFIGFSNDCFYQGLTKIRSAILILDKERNENIEMSFVDKKFLHKKTWGLKSQWKMESNDYYEKLLSQYHSILDKVKYTFLQDLKRGYFNYRLFKAYEEAVNENVLAHDQNLENQIREVVLMFPFTFTKSESSDYQTADEFHLQTMVNFVDNYFNFNEKQEYYNLLLDKMIQGLFEFAALIGNPKSPNFFDLTLQKTQRDLKFEQIQVALKMFKNRNDNNTIRLNIGDSLWLPYIREFIADEEKRINESSKNDTLNLMMQLLELDKKSFKSDIEKISGIIIKRKRNNDIIEHARVFSALILTSPKNLGVKIDETIKEFSAAEKILFKDVFTDMISPLLTYLLDLSYPSDLSRELNVSLTGPKEQLFNILEENLILDPGQQSFIYGRLLKQIACKHPLDFYDKRILAKISQLKLNVHQLTVSVEDLINMIDAATDAEKKLYFDIAIHSPAEIEDLIKCERELNVSNAAKHSLSLYYINHLDYNFFKEHYLSSTQPYNEKLAAVIEESYREDFKEDYHFKEFQWKLKDSSFSSRELLAKKLNRLHEDKIALCDYIGNDNICKLVNILYEKVKAFEESLKNSYWLDDELLQPEGIDYVLMFHQFMGELSAIEVTLENCQFFTVIDNIQKNLPLLATVMPLLKTLQSCFLCPDAFLKSFANLGRYTHYIQKLGTDKLVIPKNQSLLLSFYNNLKSLLASDGTDSSSNTIELQNLFEGKERNESDFLILNTNDSLIKKAYFNHFQKPGLNLLEEKIDQLDPSIGGNGLNLLVALKKNNTLNTVFKCAEENNNECAGYKEQYQRVANKIEKGLNLQFNAIVQRDTIDSSFALEISEWLLTQFEYLKGKLDNQMEDSIQFNQYYQLITFYLKNKNYFSSNITESIEAILLENTKIVQQKIIPKLHANSPDFLINQSLEDKKGMSVKRNRDRYFQTNALRVMIFQLVHPKETVIKDRLRLLKSAYLSKSINKNESALRFDKMNGVRSSQCVFRYNAFEAFTKEPLNTLFFEEEISPLISFLGSYRTSNNEVQVDKWKVKVSELYVKESVLNRFIASWYAFTYECYLFALKDGADCDDKNQYEQQLNEILSLFGKEKTIVQQILHKQLTKSFNFLMINDDFQSIEHSELNALYHSYRRLLNINNITFSLADEVDPFKQKKLYIIKLLELAHTVGDRDCYINMALAELKTMVSAYPASANFDLAELKKEEKEFILLIYPDQFKNQSSQLPFSDLITLIEKKTAFNKANTGAHQIEAALFQIIKGLESKLIHYFNGHLDDKNDRFMIANNFLNAPILLSKFSSQNVRNKFLVARQILSQINFVMIHFDLTDMVCAEKAELLHQAILCGEITMDQQQIESREFRGLLNSVQDEIKEFLDVNEVFTPSVGW